MSHPKINIGIFGRRNTGKSTLVNLLTGQDTAIVSDIPGTTTDPVRKSVEIFGIGPVILVDTAGVDDGGELGRKRVDKSLDTLKRVECAVLLITGNQFGQYELDLIHQFRRFNVPYLILHNKSDISRIATLTRTVIKRHSDAEVLDFSAKDPGNLEIIIDALRKIVPRTSLQPDRLIGDLVRPKALVLLITPIDSEAPEGRLILPQNRTIRDALDHHCITIVIRETELEDFMRLGIEPALVITDSQAFGHVARHIPGHIPLTSFSILFSRLKGDFHTFLRSTPLLSDLKEGDKILILESCTHQTNCDDIGRVKIPGLLQQFTGKKLSFTVVGGLSEIPPDDYAFVIQCGGCMISRKQLINRISPFIEKGIPVTNYGMALAYMNGIFERVTKLFP